MTLTSVGVATPKRRVPITKSGIRSAGIAARIWLRKARNPPSSGERGRFRRRATHQTAANMPIPSISPGRMPATKRSMIDTFDTRPKRISGIEGGISTAMVEEDALIAAAKPAG